MVLPLTSSLYKLWLVVQYLVSIVTDTALLLSTPVDYYNKHVEVVWRTMNCLDQMEYLIIFTWVNESGNQVGPPHRTVAINVFCCCCEASLCCHYRMNNKSKQMS